MASNLCLLGDKKLVNTRIISKCLTKFDDMALYHKDWEQPDTRICLAEIDTDNSLEFTIQTGNVLQ